MTMIILGKENLSMSVNHSDYLIFNYYSTIAQDQRKVVMTIWYVKHTTFFWLKSVRKQLSVNLRAVE